MYRRISNRGVIMYTGELRLTNALRTPFALSNEFERTNRFAEDVEKCNSADELLKIAKKYYKYQYQSKLATFEISKDTREYTRIRFDDGYYLIAYKDKDNIMSDSEWLELIKTQFEVSNITARKMFKAMLKAGGVE